MITILLMLAFSFVTPSTPRYIGPPARHYVMPTSPPVIVVDSVGVGR